MPVSNMTLKYTAYGLIFRSPNEVENSLKIQLFKKSGPLEIDPVGRVKGNRDKFQTGPCLIRTTITEL